MNAPKQNRVLVWVLEFSPVFLPCVRLVGNRLGVEVDAPSAASQKDIACNAGKYVLECMAISTHYWSHWKTISECINLSLCNECCIVRLPRSTSDNSRRSALVLVVKYSCCWLFCAERS